MAKIASPWLPDSPAFLGFHPPELIWQALATNDLDQLNCQLFNKLSFPSAVEKLFKLDSHHANPYGFYRAIGNDFDWFIKVVTPQQALRQQQANQVANYVADNQQQLYASRLLPSFPVTIDEKTAVLAYEFIEGRFLKPQFSDLTLLAKSLARLHLKLEQAPTKDQIKGLGLQRHQHLKQSLLELQQAFKTDDVAIELPQQVIDLLAQYQASDFDVLIEDAQPIHGDLNVGNVWLSDNQNLVFLDFEDSLTAWFNPLKDLAFVLERFVFTQSHPDEKHIELAQQFIQSYYQFHNQRLNHPQHIQQLLQALAIRALLLLIELAKNSHSEMHSEWQKFVFLYHQAQQQQAMYQKLFLLVR